MKKIALITLSLLVLFSAYAVARKMANPRVYDINQSRQTDMSDVLPALKQNRIVIVGEHHNNKRHHEAQLNVIRTLNESGIQLAVGLEMFRSDSQQALNRWVAGDIGEREFQEIFYDNWGYSWENYRIIFDYARQKKIPLIGLNVPRDITRQVATGLSVPQQIPKRQVVQHRLSGGQRVYGLHQEGFWRPWPRKSKLYLFL